MEFSIYDALLELKKFLILDFVDFWISDTQLVLDMLT